MSPQPRIHHLASCMKSMRSEVGEDFGGVVGIANGVERRVADEFAVHYHHRQALKADARQRPFVRQAMTEKPEAHALLSRRNGGLKALSQVGG